MSELSKEQHAACIATALALQSPNIEKPIPCEDCAALFEFVKTYENYYKYVLNRIEI